MKRILKISTIIILMLAAIGATVWVFYAKLAKENNAYNETLKFQTSSEKVEMLATLNTANSLSGINRFALASQTINNLDQINKMLTPYLSIKDEDVDEKRICHYLDMVIDAQFSIMPLLQEYNNKAQHGATFNKLTGSNSVYESISNYVVKYAKFLSVVNVEIDKVVNTEDDLKFQVIEIYLNVAIDTFENLYKDAEVLVPKNTSNLALVDTICDFNNLYIPNLSSHTTLFVKNYLRCNKSEFAKAFADLYANTTALNGEAINDAMYYLKVVVEG